MGFYDEKHRNLLAPAVRSATRKPDYDPRDRRRDEQLARLLEFGGKMAPVIGGLAGAGIGLGVTAGNPLGAAAGAGIGSSAGGILGGLASYGAHEMTQPYAEQDYASAARKSLLRDVLMRGL